MSIQNIFVRGTKKFNWIKSCCQLLIFQIIWPSLTRIFFPNAYADHRIFKYGLGNQF